MDFLRQFIGIAPLELSPRDALERARSSPEAERDSLLGNLLPRDTFPQPRMEASVVKGGSSDGRSLAPTAAGVVLQHTSSSINGDAEASQPLLSPNAATTAASASVKDPDADAAPAHSPSQQAMLTVIYGVTNLLSVVLIVVSNKMVLFTYKFSFVVTLTLLHSIFTAVGMAAMAGGGLFPVKKISPRHSVPVAAVYVGFIVFNNLSIQINPLGEFFGVLQRWLVTRQ
jgi:hypothetical protein